MTDSGLLTSRSLIYIKFPFHWYITCLVPRMIINFPSSYGLMVIISDNGPGCKYGWTPFVGQSYHKNNSSSSSSTTNNFVVILQRNCRSFHLADIPIMKNHVWKKKQLPLFMFEFCRTISHPETTVNTLETSAKNSCRGVSALVKMVAYSLEL